MAATTKKTLILLTRNCVINSCEQLVNFYLLRGKEGGKGGRGRGGREGGGGAVFEALKTD